MADETWETMTVAALITHLTAFGELYPDILGLPIVLGAFVPAQDEAALCAFPASLVERLVVNGTDHVLLSNKEGIAEFRRLQTLAGGRVHPGGLMLPSS